MKKVTAKDLHIQIKYGATVEQLMEKYGVDTTERLFETIRRITPGNADKFEKQIKANSKKSVKKPSIITVEKPQVEKPEPEIKTEETAETEESFAQEERKENMQMSLERLRADEDELSGICINLELIHKKMAERRREIVDEFNQEKKALLELQRLIKVNEEKTLKLLEEYNRLAEEMAQQSMEITSYKELLAEVRQQIEEQQRLRILVYSDGIVESENGDITDPNESDVIATVTELVQHPDAEELTIKEIKTVAKLIVIVKALERQFELEFDSERVQRFYETVAA